MKELKHTQIMKIYLAPDRNLLIIKTNSGNYGYILEAGDAGNCCNSAYFEHIELPKDCVGQTITAVREFTKKNINNGHGSIKTYGIELQTPKGCINFEWRCEQHSWYEGSCREIDQNELLGYIADNLFTQLGTS